MIFYNKFTIVAVSAGFFFGVLPYASAMNSEEAKLEKVGTTHLSVCIVPHYWFTLALPKTRMSFKEFAEEIRKEATSHFPDLFERQKIALILHKKTSIDQSNFSGYAKDLKSYFLRIALEPDEKLDKEMEMRRRSKFFQEQYENFSFGSDC